VARQSSERDDSGGGPGGCWRQGLVRGQQSSVAAVDLAGGAARAERAGPALSDSLGGGPVSCKVSADSIRRPTSETTARAGATAWRSGEPASGATIDERAGDGRRARCGRASSWRPGECARDG
jgi:hypothetical protein